MGITYRGRVGKIAGLRLVANITVLTWVTDEDLGSHLGAEPLSIPLDITATNTHDTTEFEITSGSLPAGLTLVGNVISGTPTNLASNNSFTIRASNNNSTSDRTFTLDISLNAAPVWSTPAGSLGSFIEEDEAFVQLSATDPEGHTVVYSLASGTLPTGWELSNTGAISGTADDSVATYSFSVRASDGAVHSDRAFSIDIGPNENPAWNSPAAGSLGSVLDTANAFTRTFSATDPEGRPVTYSISSGALPGNLSLNANTGVLNGLFTPVVGTQVFNFNVRASDGVKHSDRSFSLSVEHDVGPVWVTAPNLGTFLSDTELNVNVVATDANNSAITYSAANGTTFPGMVAVSSAGLLSGLLPTVSNNTVYDFGVVASDGFLSNSRTFSLTVRANAPPVWVTNSVLGPFTVNSAISNVTLSATDPDGDTVSFALSNSTSLPTGLSLANGVISGTPTVVANNSFILRASDPYGGNAYRTFYANVGAGIQFVGSAGTAGAGTVNATKPAGLAGDDLVFIFIAYTSGSAAVNTPGWAKVEYTFPTYGYISALLYKRISSAEAAGTITVSGISTQGLIMSVYRGAEVAVQLGSGEGPASTIDLTRAAKNVRSLGQVAFIADRDPSGAPTITSSGWTQRQYYAPEHFQMYALDRIDGTQPSGSGTDTFSGMTNSYPQVGFNMELRTDDPSAFPPMTANVMNGYVASASNSQYGAAYLAFDQSNSTFWGSNPDVSWLQIQFPGKRTVTNYFVRNRTGFTNQTPTAFEFQGSNDDSNWDTLDTRTSVTFTDGGENSYTIGTPGAYRYYRLNILDNANNGTIAVVAGLRFTFA